MIDHAKTMTILLENGENKQEDSMWERTNYTYEKLYRFLQKLHNKHFQDDDERDTQRIFHHI